jgi:hypothetical protein
MSLDREKKLSLAIVALVILAQAIVLAPELSTSAVRDTDAINHYTMTKQMVDAMEHGENPLDFWSPEISLGIPMVRTYQPLAHILVAGAYFALGKSASVMTVMVWVRYLVVLLLPLSCYAAMVLMDFPPLTAAAAALLLPMVAGPRLGMLGMDIRSWIGNGVYPQVVATNLLFAALGLSWRAIRQGRNVTIAGTALGLTCLAHLMWGWMGALSACVMALMPDPTVPRMLRVRRIVVVGAVAAAISMFQLVPLLTDGYLINHARSEPPEKFDSFGAGPVLGWLFSGQIMDQDRLPVLSLLSLFGAGLLLWRWKKIRKLAAPELFVLLACLLWILVFFGRPTWGILLLLLGVSGEFHLHRVLATVQMFLLMLAAIGLATLWREVSRRWNVAGAAILTVVALTPMAIERVQWVNFHEAQGWATVAAVNTAAPAFDQVTALASQRGGRVYAGLPTNWGYAFKTGATPVYTFLIMRLLPAVSFAYNASVFPSDVMTSFDELKPEQYRLFNIRTIVAPPLAGAPPFLTRLADIEPFRVLDAPGTGYFGLVDVPATARVNRDNIYDLNIAWLKSDWLPKDQYVWLDFDGSTPKNLQILTPAGPMPQAPAPASPAGLVSNERQTRQVYEADLDAARPAFALFRVTYHFCWKVYVDGRPQPTMMLTPGYLGTSVPAGKHHILCRYEPGNWKLWMAAAGFLVTLLLVVAERVRFRTSPK